MLTVLLRRAGYEVTPVEGVRTALAAIASNDPFDVVVTDLSMPDGTGLDVLSAARKRDDSTQIVLITAYATTEQAVLAMRQGAYDYIQKPFKNDEFRATLEKAVEKRSILNENRVLRARVREGFRSGSLLGRSAAMGKVLQLVDRIASAKTNVLITGESGTGKEMVARAIHERSDRSAAPFVVVNCGALPENLMESELFGHEKGAFTGAQLKKEGLFRAAHGGTLLLDEVGELPLPVQVKLLRVLQDRRVRPVGGETEFDVDVRVVAATNRDVEKDVAEGRFRQDLFYRLNVIRIALPPLRERSEDIPVLAAHFLEKHGAFAGRRLSFSSEALRWIVSQAYPGNVRELENVVERAVALSLGPQIELLDLPTSELAVARTNTGAALLPEDGMDLDRFLSDSERSLLLQALERSGGGRTAAAKLLGMTFRSFRYRLAKYGIADADEADADEK